MRRILIRPYTAKIDNNPDSLSFLPFIKGQLLGEVVSAYKKHELDEICRHREEIQAIGKRLVIDASKGYEYSYVDELSQVLCKYFEGEGFTVTPVQHHINEYGSKISWKHHIVNGKQ